jgi:hypothetical protein
MISPGFNSFRMICPLIRSKIWSERLLRVMGSIELFFRLDVFRVPTGLRPP